MGAGVCIGLALASKWDAIWYLLGLAGLVIAWDVGARRAAGLPNDVLGTLRRHRWLPAWFGLVPLAVYVVTWSGWFFTSTGYDRQWAAQNGLHIPVISALASFAQYQKQMLQFHLGLTTHHPYQSQPWTWLVMSRPVAFFWQCPAGGTHGACASSKAQEVLAIGTPLIWWASIATLLVCVAWWLTRRDWRAGALLLAVAVGWLPWFWFALHDHRTEFFFYALEFEPFLILSITLCLGLIIGSARASAMRRTVGAAVVGRLPARGAAELRVPVPGPDRQDHSVYVVAVAHVVSRLDLAERPGQPVRATVSRFADGQTVRRQQPLRWPRRPAAPVPAPAAAPSPAART